MKNKIYKAFQMLLSLPKTIFFNMYYFNVHVAIKLPVFVKYNVKLQSMKGDVKLHHIKPGIIKIGFHCNRPYNNVRNVAVWHLEYGIIEFKGSASIGNGTALAVTGHLILGDNFVVSGNSKFICGAKTVFGDNVMIGYDCFFLDYDAHGIFDCETNARINNKRGIALGDNIWIGACSKIIPGAGISDHSMVALGSLVCKKHIETNVLLAGIPAKIVKTNIKIE
jgi:acetyltransferase-like isoleucine patch superfamily enzyme